MKNSANFNGKKNHLTKGPDFTRCADSKSFSGGLSKFDISNEYIDFSHWYNRYIFHKGSGLKMWWARFLHKLWKRGLIGKPKINNEWHTMFMSFGLSQESYFINGLPQKEWKRRQTLQTRPVTKKDLWASDLSIRMRKNLRVRLDPKSDYDWIVMNDGTIYLRQINTVQDQGGTWRLTLVGGQTMPTVDVSQIQRFARARLSRFDRDSMTERWASTEVCRLSISTVEVQQEKEVDIDP